MGEADEDEEEHVDNTELNLEHQVAQVNQTDRALA